MSFGSRSASVKYGVAYGRALELGNPKKNVAARPFLEPTIKAKQKDTQRYIEQEIAKAVGVRNVTGQL